MAGGKGGDHVDRRHVACFAARPAHGLTVDRDDPFGEARHRGHPGDEAVLELFGIERCEDVANPVVRWRPILEGAEAA